MKVSELEIFEVYKAALTDYLHGGGEKALRWAYEFGRRALAEEVRSIDLIASHQQTVAELMVLSSSPEESARISRSAYEFLVECLSSFEMTFRGYRDALATLQQSEDRFRRLFESAPDVIYTLDPAGVIKSLNPIFETITGWPRSAWVGKPFGPLVHPDDLALASKIHQQVLHGDRPPVFDLRITMPNHEYRVAEITTVPDFHQGQVIGTFGIARDITERKLSQLRLKQMAKRVLEAQEEERRRLSRELHDDLCQWLSGTKLTIGMVEEAVSSNRTAAAKLRKIGQQINDRIIEVRRMSTTLRPSALDDFGLCIAMERFCEDLAKIHEVEIFFQKTGIEYPLYPSEVEIALYRILQEALSNVVNHARASRVLVSLRQNDRKLILEISDNGIGFTETAPTTSRIGEHGYGLLSMKERSELVGGSFRLESTPGSGTTVHVEMPFLPEQP